MNTNPENTERHYIHAMAYTHRERIVGMFVFLGFILFLFFILISVKNQHLFDRRVMYYLEVKSNEGISHGSLVTVLGTEVGRVASLTLVQDQKIRVAIEVYKDQQPLIKKGAKALVNRLTNIGNALIEIESGSMDAPMLVEGATIPVEETPSLNDLLLGMASIIQTVGSNQLLTNIESILPKLERTVENAYRIIEQIATGHGVLGAAVFDKKVEKELKSVVTSGAEILSEAEGIIGIAKQRLVELEPLLIDATKVAHDVQGATQDLPGMVLELNKIIAQANTALALINGELLNIPGTTVDVKRAVTKADRLLDSVQNTWPLSNDIENTSNNQLIPLQPSHD